MSVTTDEANKEFATIKRVTIERHERADIQLLAHLNLHKDTEASGARQQPMFARWGFAPSGLHNAVDALFRTCGTDSLDELNGKPLVVWFDKPPRVRVAGSGIIAHVVAFGSVDGEHLYSVEHVLSGEGGQ